MNVVLLRVGIDTGCGGIHSPLYADGSFEFVPIPDDYAGDERTYGNTTGRKGTPFAEYFYSPRKMAAMRDRSMHVDPEFETFTYGDPTSPKRGLANLEPGDLLVFYAGMEGWEEEVAPALYLAGYFRVKLAGWAADFSDRVIKKEFASNMHVRHPSVFAEQKDSLILIKGDATSRLFEKSHKLGERVRRENGTYWQMITPAMAKIFGKFGGIGSLQRSTPRWVDEGHTEMAEKFVLGLE